MPEPREPAGEASPRRWSTISAPLAALALSILLFQLAALESRRAQTPSLKPGASGSVAFLSAVVRSNVLSALSQIASSIPSDAPLPDSPPCSAQMVLVDGDYCPEVTHDCVHWLDDQKLPFARCGRYAPPARCETEKVHLRFCIDREELTRPGETLPANFLSLNRSAKLCRAANKRLCLESEWNFACEGEEMRPYPYGWSRASVCNQDRQDLFEMQNGKQVLRDLRARASDFPQCISAMGVLNMVGNLDEPVLRDGKPIAPMRTALKGGWWMAGRNRCRPATTAHDDDYNDVQIGARCCSDPL